VSMQGPWEPDDVKLLIVDDEPRNLDALEVMLQSSGCRFVRAHSADEALLALLHDNFAAMILDIRMPGMQKPHWTAPSLMKASCRG